MCCLFCDAHSHDWEVLSQHMLDAHKGEELPVTLQRVG